MPVEQINNTTGAVTYLHHDQAGSTRLLTGSTGKTEGSYSYSPYGTPEHTGTATTPLGYDAQYTNSDTGLIYMRARTYDPATAQFLSVDPFVALTGEPYSYGEDNPLNRADPTGRCGLLCIGGIVLGGVAVATGVGEVVGAAVVIGDATVSLGTVSAATGALGAVADTKECVAGDSVACIGATVGGLRALGAGAVGLGYVTGEVASGATAIGLTAGGIGFLGDVASAFATPESFNGATAAGCG
jgi:RHS repeat-associated protein